jgi:drug/metabolite transporter (DMT)-like permease
MNRLWSSPGLLLLATGSFLGFTFPLGKIAAAAGVSPFVWAFLIAAGSASVLALASLVGGRLRVGLDKGRLRYFMIAALVSYALPNMLVFSAIPRLGAGFTSILFTLSPILTLLISLMTGLRKPGALGVAGIVVGFAGALIVTLTRGEVGKPADPVWIFLGLLIPLSLAIGNIYRSIDWPKDGGPIELAIGSNAAAAVMLVAASFLFTGGFRLGELAAAPEISLAQVIASSLMFAVFFRLQIVGGPIYLSQIGYIAAAIGLVSGTLLLGESYAALTWIGALVIAAGVVMTTLAQRDAAKPS